MTAPPSPAWLRDDVAAALDEPASTLDDHEDLFDRGLDSIRLMSLIERWRRAGHAPTFLDLAQEPTLAAWSTLMATDPEHTR